jgi:hypothetical protein
MLNCHAHCKPNEYIINEGNIIKSKSNNIINAGDIISIRNSNENKVRAEEIRIITAKIIIIKLISLNLVLFI